MRSLTRPLVTGMAIPDGSGVTLLARLRGQGGAYVTQASLSAIGWAVTDLTVGIQLGTGTFTVGQVIYDSIQLNDPRWQVDVGGYNFLAVLPASLFPVRIPAAPDPLAGLPPAALRQADVTFTPLAGQPFKLCIQWQEMQAWG